MMSSYITAELSNIKCAHVESQVFLFLYILLQVQVGTGVTQEHRCSKIHQKKHDGYACGFS